MSAALSYESLEDMPEGMRRLVEKQLAKKAERETTQGNVHCGATTPQSASQTAPPTRGALHLIRPCGAPSPQGEGIAGGNEGPPLRQGLEEQDFGTGVGPLQPPAAAAPPEGEPLRATSRVAPTALTRGANGPSGTPSPTAGTGDSGRNKYGNKPTERILPNGKNINFGSKKEAAYYDSLLIQQRMGLVRNIRLQYQFLLKPAYTDGETGERFRAVSYLADFVFERNEDGQWKRVIVDTKGGKRKGTRTSTYAIKRKLMAEMGYIIEEA